MTTQQHSPGPWRAEGFKGIVVNSAIGFTICACPSGSKDASIEEIQANARLISSAPQLLSALEAVVALSRKHRWQVNSDEVSPFPAARVAIEKARGE